MLSLLAVKLHRRSPVPAPAASKEVTPAISLACFNTLAARSETPHTGLSAHHPPYLPPPEPQPTQPYPMPPQTPQINSGVGSWGTWAASAANPAQGLSQHSIIPPKLCLRATGQVAPLNPCNACD